MLIQVRSFEYIQNTLYMQQAYAYGVSLRHSRRNEYETPEKNYSELKDAYFSLQMDECATGSATEKAV